jgi:hypothetical protein
MVVTIESYTTAGANYTAANLATAVGDALIDTGIMTDWHDSFTSGSIEGRVLEVVYDNSKTYGKTYYNFLVSGADMFTAVSSGWNSSSNIPAGPSGAGSEYLDWFSTTISTSNALRLTASASAGFNNAQSAVVRRYTSAARANFSVIKLVNGTTSCHFCIERTAPNSSMVDLDLVFYTSLGYVRLANNSSTAQAGFTLYPLRTRRTQLGQSLRGVTNAADFGLNANAVSPWVNSTTEKFCAGFEYGFPGNDNNSNANYLYARGIIPMPVHFNNVNPAATSDIIAPFSGMPFNPFSSATLPSDFAIIPVYNSNTIQDGATLQVSAGVEEYEVISVLNSTAVGRPSIVFGARTV